MLYPSPESSEKKHCGERSTCRVDYLGQLDISRAEHKWCDGHVRRIGHFLQPAQRELSFGDKRKDGRAQKDDTGGRESGESVAMRPYFYLHGTGSPRFHSFAQCRTVKYRPHKNFGENIGQPSSLQQTRGLTAVRH